MNVIFAVDSTGYDFSWDEHICFHIVLKSEMIRMHNRCQINPWCMMSTADQIKAITLYVV